MGLVAVARTNRIQDIPVSEGPRHNTFLGLSSTTLPPIQQSKCDLRLRTCSVQPLHTGALGPAAAASLSISPGGGGGDSFVNRMRQVLKRHQCGFQEEAVTVCMRQAAAAAAKPSALRQASDGPCSGYINSLRYCQLHTQQHNCPVAPAFLY